ncbi:YdeI/OmpD-associated family protein [Flammeovirga yaeyamensis]|uniref:YdeI/OmpD-associated family protein n=1 Tax=Flammeovirga yaeyamensis TaxID=367791 RepID=A0AAX1NCZ4_9BACT|nr:YdeI/OmpD-associated family protein [Flammeovirga yaeyamensis]MBB3698692.1 uncharacterized protein YdeI (YjbR/CyaY-like superfamily) [Flammeovirga yaeyamensis]NMF37279.1 hypothetical protein [Flammeovirga yaeyamensis]QWG03903.1 YdeI/OmpD-associated family protein [Flammeovirga yaeyamensis]
MKGYKTVDAYINGSEQWGSALEFLRALLLDTELEEGVKWGAPIYMIKGKNVIGMAAFKQYVGLWFHHGALLKDKQKVLYNAQEGKTKGLRQWRFQSLEELIDAKEVIIDYVKEAIDNQKAGREVEMSKKTTTVALPELLITALTEDPSLKSSFDTLTPGKRKEYAEYIETAKREATKLSRLEKIKPMIKEGVGLNDKYK